MGADTPEIAVGTVQGGLYLGLAGRATQRTCPTAGQLVGDYLSTHPPEPKIVIDLDGCGWVDSTFAGWLVGVNRRIEHLPGGQLCVAGCSDRCRKSLEKMHLARLFRFETIEAPAETRIVACVTSDHPTKEELELMLEAHESLAGLSEQNQRVFGPIAAMLRQQVENA